MRRGSTKRSNQGSRHFSCERLEPRLMLDGVTDQVGDTLDDSELLTLAPEFPHETIVVGSIESSFDRDVYRFTVPDDGASSGPLLMTVRQQAMAPSDGLDSVLTVFNGAGMLLASSDDAVGSDSALSVLVLSGESYFIQAAGFYDSAGDYRLTVEFGEVPDALPDPVPAFNTTDDFPSSSADAEIESFDARGMLAWAGSLEQPGDVDAFRFTATSAGGVRIRAVSFPEGGFVGHVEIVDEQGTVLAEAEDEGGLFPATELSLAVVADATYGIRVSGLEDSYGEYTLIVSPIAVQDDYGDLPATAYQLVHPSSGHSYLLGTLDTAEDVDVIRLAIPTAGTATVVLARNASTLDANLELFSANGESLTVTEMPPGSVGERRLQFQAAAGQEVFARVSSLTGSSGKYSLDVTSIASTDDDFTDTGTGVTLIELSPNGFGAQSGKIDATADADTDPVKGDVDVFDFIAPFTGQLLYRRLVPQGVLFSADVKVSLVIDAGTDHELVQAMPPASLSLFDNREIEFAVTAGAHYRIEVVSFHIYQGDYFLTFRGVPNAAPTLDEAGVDFENAVLIDLSSGGIASIAGAIDSAADEDFHKFVAPFTGKVFVTQTGGIAGIRSHLTAFVANEEEGSPEPADNEDPFELIYSEIADDDGTGGLDALLGFEIVKGETYYLRSKSDGGLGPYALSLRAFEGGLSITPLGAPHEGGTLDAVDLVMELLGGTLSSDSMTIDLDSIEFLGAAPAAGLFTGAGDLFASDGVAGFDRGVILTNGKAANAVGPNFSRHSEQDNGIDTVDARFADYVNQLTNGKPAFDTSILAFSFKPEVDVIQLRFVFASEEYPEFVLKGFHDTFGVFVNGVNYARVPGTDNYIAGTGEVISIDTINPVTHEEYFVDNATRPHAPYGPLDIEYDGLTTVITLTIPVLAGQDNEMALVIADVNDNLLDSAVFVQADSLNSTRESIDDPIGEALLGDFSTIVHAVGGVPDATPEKQHQEIHEQFIYEFLKQLGVPLVGGVLIIAVDPVDWTLVGPNGAATVNRNGEDVRFPNVFYTSNGSNDLIIIPNATLADYSVQLTGVGSNDFRFGASYIAPDGVVTTRLWQSAPEGRYTTAVAFDFRTLTGDLVTESITLTQASDPVPPSPSTALAPSLDGVFFAVATSGRAPVTQASVTTSTDSVGGGDDSGGGAGGGSAGGGEAAPTSTRLASTGSGGGKVRTGRPGALNVVSLYLDEILREIGVGGDDLGNDPASTQLRSFLRALLFRVHVPFLFPLDLGHEEPPAVTPRGGDGDSSPQAEGRRTSPHDAQTQSTARPTTAERALTSHSEPTELDTAAISSPHPKATARARLLGAAAVALCLSMSTRPSRQSFEDRRRRVVQAEHRRSCETTCPTRACPERQHSRTRRARRGHPVSGPTRTLPQHSFVLARRKHRYRRSSRGCFV